MADNKKSFILYKNIIKDVSKLSDVDAGILFKQILNYTNGVNTKIPMNLIGLYNSIINSIELEWKKYNPKTKKYHWNYKGGITDENKLIRNSAKYKHWRNAVFKRDNFTCQKCKKHGGILNAHHVRRFCDYKHLRMELDNGITLCTDCHKKEHNER